MNSPPNQLVIVSHNWLIEGIFKPKLTKKSRFGYNLWHLVRQPTAFHRFEVDMLNHDSAFSVYYSTRIIWTQNFLCIFVYLNPTLWQTWGNASCCSRRSFFPPQNDRAGKEFLLTCADSPFHGKTCNFMHLFCTIIMQTRQNRKITRSYLCSVTTEKIKGRRDRRRQS